MLSGGLRTKNITKQPQENNPLITVVTVVRNGEKTIEQTILSIINQTYHNIEYIIVDGASTDGTLGIIKRYEDRVDYWISEPDKGIYDAMNKGIDLAKGDYIALLNSDDWYEQDTCEIIANKINEVKADVYYGIVRVIDKNNIFIYVTAYYIYNINHYMIPHQTCFISKEIYTKFRYDINYKLASDYDFIIRIYKFDASFCFIEKIMTNCKTGGMSSSMTCSIEKLEIKRKYKFMPLHKYYIKIILVVINHIYIKLGLTMKKLGIDGTF